MYMEVEGGRELREILQGNPMWPDETYRIYVLEEKGPVKNEPIPTSKQRFLILARPASRFRPTSTTRPPTRCLSGCVRSAARWSTAWLRTSPAMRS